MIILNQDAERRRLDIVELPRADSPAEREHASTSEEEGERDQDVETAVHRVRSAAAPIWSA